MFGAAALVPLGAALANLAFTAALRAVRLGGLSRSAALLLLNCALLRATVTWGFAPWLEGFLKTMGNGWFLTVATMGPMYQFFRQVSKMHLTQT